MDAGNRLCKVKPDVHRFVLAVHFELLDGDRML